MAQTAAGRSDAATRVVDAQRHAARTLRLAVAFVVSAPISALAAEDLGRWLPLHVFLVGAVLTAISAATQLFAVTWSASPAPTDATATVQRWLIAGGATLLLIGRATGTTIATAVGGAGVLAGLVLLAVILVDVRRTSGNARFHPAIDGYLVALAWAALGLVLGLGLALTDPGRSWTRIRDAHVTINLLGLVGLVIAATLPYFVATQARTKMSPAATPRSIRTTVIGMAAAVAVAASGQALDIDVAVVAGFASYAVALCWLLHLWPSVGRRQIDWAGPRLLQLATGIGWWFISVALLGTGALVDAVDTTRAVQVLVVGGFAQILVASMAYLGPVLRGGGHERLSAGFATTRSVPSLVLGNIAPVALLAGAERVAVWLLLAWAAVVAVTAVRLVAPTAPAASQRTSR